ncbi:Protein of unknown function DUF4495, partial [Trinorchestia longiramus]
MNVVTLEASGITSACKDFLSAEWSSYKKSGECKVGRVCVYSVGGPRGNSIAVLNSVASGLQECELLLRDVVDAKVAFDCPVLDSEVVVGADCSSFGEAVSRATDLIDVLSQSVLYHQCELLRSSLMHDADSHDWCNEKPYQEGEQVSTAIRMWIFHMQGVRNDLYRYSSPADAHSLLSGILSDTLNILVTRYMQATPSDRRVTQYRGDVLSILAMVAALLPSLVQHPSELFQGTLHHSPVLPLHRRAQLLLAVAAVKVAPLPLLVKHKKLLQTSTLRTGSSSFSAVNIISTPAWLTFLNKDLYPPEVVNMAQLPNNVATLHMMLQAASSAAPNWPLLVRSLVHKSLYGARALVCGLRDYWSGSRQQQPCGGALCAPHLCAPPLTPQTVYAAVVQVVYRCVDGRYLLRQLLFPDKINPASWDSLDRAQVWNSQRPPWHHVLVQLAVPVVIPAVQQVMKTLPPVAPAQPAHPSQASVRLEHHLTAWILQLFKGIETAADEIPECLVEVCRSMDQVVPPAVSPLGGHVICQVLVEALYSVINSRPSVSQLCEASAGVTEDQWNMFTAMAERLCSLTTDAFTAAVKAIYAATATRLGVDAEEEDEVSALPDPLCDFPSEQMAEVVSESLCSQVLAAVQGQHALGVIRTFLQHNLEWVQQQLETPPLLPLDPDTRQRPFPLLFAPEPLIYNPLYYHAMLFYAKFQQ